MNEAVTRETPRDVLEKAEQIPEPSHEELAFALGRLLVWMLDGKTLVKIGQRTTIVAAKLRPDLIAGATLYNLAKRRKFGRSQAANLAVEFTRTFGIRGLNDKATRLRSARLRQAWVDRRPGARLKSKDDHHLRIVNRFADWHATLANAGTLPTTPKARERMRRDFEPIARFIAELERAI